MSSILAFLAVGVVLGMASRLLAPALHAKGPIPPVTLALAGALVGGFVGAFGVRRETALSRLDAGTILLSAVGALIALVLHAAALSRQRRPGVP